MKNSNTYFTVFPSGSVALVRTHGVALGEYMYDVESAGAPYATASVVSTVAGAFGGRFQVNEM
ncbi:hypothetical protein ACWF0M_12425 [Kribbella sp. NPDC055110]